MTNREELQRILRALALELPEPVHRDASRRILELFDAASSGAREGQPEPSNAAKEMVDEIMLQRHVAEKCGAMGTAAVLERAANFIMDNVRGEPGEAP